MIHYLLIPTMRVATQLKAAGYEHAARHSLITNAVGTGDHDDDDAFLVKIHVLYRTERALFMCAPFGAASRITRSLSGVHVQNDVAP